MFPTAQVKFYLTATPALRAERRVRQEPGLSHATVLNDILRRDRADMTRTTAPLTPAPDAIQIDTSDLTVHQVIHHMATAYRARHHEDPPITAPE